ncbi:MAG: 4Fe-4S binding protein, partial [Gemmatimonadota bacterium]
LAGAALGAAWSGRARGAARALLARLDAGLAALCLGLAPLLVGLHGAPAAAPLAPAAFAAYAAATGFLVGAQLPAAARLGVGTAGRRAGALFGLDLVGGCVGGLGAGVFALPLVGLPGTCVLLGGLKLGTALALWATRAQPAAVATGRAPGQVVAAAIALFAFAGAGLTMAAEGAGSGLYGLTFSPWFQALVLGLFGATLAGAAGLAPGAASELGRLRRWSLRLEETTAVSLLRWLSFVGAGLVVFYPVFRCFFSVPWLFCHACPRPCAFGYLRPYVVPAALLANLERRHWCQTACPLGTLHQCQAGLSRRPRRLRQPLTWLAFASLTLAAVGYFEVWGRTAGTAAPGSWFTFFYRDAFAVTPAVLAVAALLLLAGFRWLRPFCDLLCPVGTLSELVLKLEHRWVRRAAAKEAGHVL